MTIETLEVAGFVSAMKALRLPYNKEMRSIDRYIRERNIIADEDINLAQKLILTGDSHAKPMRGIIAWADITAPLYFWSEIETYRAGHERLFSASTQNTECRKLSGVALQQAKHEIPYDRPIRKIDFFSYQCLRNIIIQRHNHRAPEWHEFIEWILTLPHASEFILTGLEEELKIHHIMYEDYLAEVETLKLKK